MSFFLETKQQSQATTIENLKSETGWEFTVLLIKKTECICFEQIYVTLAGKVDPYDVTSYESAVVHKYIF